MTIKPNDIAPVDLDMDDLDSFSDIFHGKVEEKAAAPAVKEEILDEEVIADVKEEVEDEDPDGDADPEPAPKPKKNRFQERINELTAKAREAERALEALRAEQNPKRDEPAKPIPVVQNDPDPNAKLEDGSDKYPLGEFDPQYIRDMARITIDREWNTRKEQEVREQVVRQEQQIRQEIQNNWVGKVNETAEKHEDFLDKTLELEDTFKGLEPQYSDYLVQTIKSLDHGPEVLYYFANHLDEAKELVQLGALKATLALGKINAMFGSTARKDNKITTAPTPPQLNKGSKVRKTVADDTDDLDAFSQKFFSKK